MMKFNSHIHHRRSIRLKGYNYSQAGAYFITICVQDKENLFGEIKNGKLILNDVGEMANDYWLAIPKHFSNAILHELIKMSMPDTGTINDMESRQNQFGKSVPGSISVIVNQYKSSVKRWCNKNNCKYFRWQSRFYEHIIRNEQSYQTIADYIFNNPAKWNDDKFFME